MISIANGQHVAKRRNCDVEKNLAIALIREEYRVGAIDFEEFFKKMCYQVVIFIYIYYIYLYIF